MARIAVDDDIAAAIKLSATMSARYCGITDVRACRPRAILHTTRLLGQSGGRRLMMILPYSRDVSSMRRRHIAMH